MVDMKKSVRMSSPEPMDLPGEFKKMSYKELNKFSLSSISTPETDEDLSSLVTTNDGSSKLLQQRKRKPTARLANASHGYLHCVHRSLFQLRLDMKMDEPMSDEEEEDDDDEEEEMFPKISANPRHRRLPKRFDSTACLILPNSYCISPRAERGGFK